VPESALATRFGRDWAGLRDGVRRLVRQREPVLDVLQRLISMPALVPALVEELHDARYHTLAGHLMEAANPGDRQSREILLAPTYRCNLTCSYCYAKEFSTDMPPDMSLDDLEYALSWAADYGVESILLGGGEPTVYAHFPELLRMASERRMRIRLTSNGLYSAKLRERIAVPAVQELVAHFDQERMRRDRAGAELFESNLRAAQSGGLDVLLRYTLTERSSPAEWRTIMDLAQRLGIPQLNYGLAFEGWKGLNSYFNARTDIESAGGRIERILSALFDDAARHALRLHLSKPFPLCALSPGLLRRALTAGGLRPACAIHRDGFTRNVTINPDLSTFPCNGIALRGPKISQLKSFRDAGKHYAAAVESLMLQPYAEQCRDCALWYRGICRGTCLAERQHTSSHEEAKG
jgi:radical SAM protein with 4Fe4S-binding SPASM domain